MRFHTLFILYPRLCYAFAWELPCLRPGFAQKLTRSGRFFQYSINGLVFNKQRIIMYNPFFS